MGPQDRDYMHERRFGSSGGGNGGGGGGGRWWRKWQSWLAIAVTVVGLASTTVWLFRDVGSLIPSFGPEPGSLVVNINTSTEEELQTVPGIGPARAAQIIAGRPWKSVEQLEDLRGISAAQVEDMRPFLTVTGETGKRR